MENDGRGRRRRFWWLTVKYTGAALNAGGTVGFLVAYGVGSDAGGWRLIELFLGATTLGIVGSLLYKTGARRSAWSAEELLRLDGRQPVLYLRSFREDDVASQNLSHAFEPTYHLDESNTEEDRLAAALAEIGPVIAIGEPGEELPRMGAARLYLENANWQERVKELIGRSRLTVIRVGASDNVWWEVQTAIEMIGPERLLFVLPYGEVEYSEFRQRLEKLIVSRLPAYPLSLASLAGSIRGFLYFDADWKPHILIVKNGGVLKEWKKVFRMTLSPVFERVKCS